MARKILLADDSVTAQNMGRRILQEAGYEVFTVNNGSAALKKIAEVAPDLVVLDVYMPGYSGLEVCQRLKAASETAAVPVLLTVGKLEPFKAEEAKKVFADAFIIKPFEATELLNALTRLEEKIVPQPAAKAAPAKPAPAPSHPPSKREKPQEDQEWKDRLRIQAAPVQVEEPTPPAPPTPAHPATQFHDIRHDIAAAETDDALAASLPENVTSEELAAITAAVSAFTHQDEVEEEGESAGAEESPANEFLADRVPYYVPQAQPESEPVGVVEDHTAAEEIAEEVAAAEETESLESISPWANPALLEEVAAAFEPPPAEVPPEPEIATAVPVPAADHFTDSEVDAALASLGADDIMSRLQAEEQAHVRSLEYFDSKTAEGWSAEQATIGSTRWIAEEMKLEENESSLILEEEMQRAQAALQAEEEARAVAAAARIQAPEEPAPAMEYVAEAQVAEAAPVDAISSIELPESEVVAEVASVAVAEETNAFAAAASANGNAASIYVDMAASAPVEEIVEPEQKQEDPELAAAWARWRQIRESVASPEFVSQVADVATAELQSAQQQETSSAPASAPTPDANAIASIVDSVLAQLKPKLVEEIAKQLGEKK